MKRTIAVLALSAVAFSSVAASSAAPARAAETPRRVLLEGRGWGHGRGMGQWGARGMALDGVSWGRILHHYYSDVRIARAGKDRSRIAVLLDTKRRVTFRAPTRFTIRWSGQSVTGKPGSFYRLKEGVLYRAASHRGPWHRILATSGTVRVGGARMALVSGGGRQRAYLGTFKISRSGRQSRIVNVVRLGDYLRGVVPREMPSSWPIEALKAQAAAARTYAVRVRARARSIGSSSHICDDARCQVYSGFAFRPNARSRWIPLTAKRIDRAIRGTAGRVITYKGKPILAEYSSSTGGYTTSGRVPSLRPVRDRADRIAPLHRWFEDVSGTSIRRAWPRIGRFERLRITARNGLGAWNGRVRRLRLIGSSGSVRVSGDEFRSRMGLRSDWFRIAPRSARYHFRKTLRPGMDDGAVGSLQRRLRAAGVYGRGAPITSFFGPVTRASVQRYQTRHGISPTGIVGPRTRAVLNKGAGAKADRYRFGFNMGYGTTHPAVGKLQRRLRAEGVYPSSAPFTRYFGHITKTALRRYQARHGIQQTGFLGPITRRSLNR